MDQFGGLLVEEQVGYKQVVHALGAEQRIHVDPGERGDVGKQPRAGFREPVHFRGRALDGALVALDVDDLGLLRIAATGAFVGHHAFLVDGAHLGDGGAAQVAQLQALRGAEVPRDDLVGKLVIRDRRLGGVGALLAHLFVRLVDREVELRIQGLVFPGAALAVVVGELGVAGHQQDQQQESDAEREEEAEFLSVHRAAI